MNSSHRVYCVTNKFGCKIEESNNGRCDKYLTCKNYTECLSETPAHWKGFVSISSKGYLEKAIEEDTSKLDIPIEQSYGVLSLKF